MLKVCKVNNSKALNQIKDNVLDGIVMSNSNLIDDIILSMKHEGILDMLDIGDDKRYHNVLIPFNIIMALAITAKMKAKTSMTDMPHAITDGKTLAELGYNLIGKELNKGLLSEGTIRHLLGKWNSDDWISYYNNTVQNHIMRKQNIQPNLHILDCTNIRVNLNNENYENATVAIDKDKTPMRGYKLSTIRGIVEDSGTIEDIRFGTVKTHAFKLSEEMLKTTPCFHEGDILLNDSGFLSRDMINYLKTVRKVDTYIPLRKNMDIYNVAVASAEIDDNWQTHPTRKNQMIAHITNLGEYWKSENPSDDVDINASVVWFQDTQSYAVFVTTDMTKSAKDIIKTYQLRPEIEEDYRQLKDFWKMEDFKSTKYDVITFHIVNILLGYLFYQLYLFTNDGQKYIGESLPIILKNYQSQFTNYITMYSGEYCAVLTLKEFMEFFDRCNDELKITILKFI